MTGQEDFGMIPGGSATVVGDYRYDLRREWYTDRPGVLYVVEGTT